MAEPMTTHKLMILAMLDQVEMPLPYTVLADFFLLSEYSHYFAMQEALAELLEQNFIRKKEAPNDTRYEITGEGKKLLHTLSNKLTDGIYEDIKKYLREHQIQIREVTDLKAHVDLISLDYLLKLNLIFLGINAFFEILFDSL